MDFFWKYKKKSLNKYLWAFSKCIPGAIRESISDGIPVEIPGKMPN